VPGLDTGLPALLGQLPRDHVDLFDTAAELLGRMIERHGMLDLEPDPRDGFFGDFHDLARTLSKIDPMSLHKDVGAVGCQP
jgi:hypothetical protein